jgi:Na+-transporting methylmalonyl-CoA/oxaloacetate decarboxylase beta subunit
MTGVWVPLTDTMKDPFSGLMGISAQCGIFLNVSGVMSVTSLPPSCNALTVCCLKSASSVDSSI